MIVAALGALAIVVIMVWWAIDDRRSEREIDRIRDEYRAGMEEYYKRWRGW